ncbi:MAG: transporter substrate-binding domain-containing protein [Devosia sp.]|nr:transporter substrate-binding domain-containing protein [Devosia sp.]
MPAKLLIVLLVALFGWGGAAFGDTLSDIRNRGAVTCGTSAQSPGFSAIQVDGNWVGLGADYCRGLAAVIFNDPAKVEFTLLAPGDETAALKSGRVDTLADLLSWTLTDDTDQGLRFVATLFYDGQGFLAPKGSGLRTSRDLAGKGVCVEDGSAAAANAAEYFDADNIAARLERMPNREAAIAAYVSGGCIAYTDDSSVLAGIRASLPTPTDNVLLPDLISKQPLAVVVRQGDDRWFDVARWTVYALLDAEELSVTQGNVDEMLGSDNISVRRLLGVEGDFGAEIGLNKDWAYQLIKGVGNYADLFDRNVGDQSPLKLPRGLNALWSRGGIQYSPPVR